MSPQPTHSWPEHVPAHLRWDFSMAEFAQRKPDPFAALCDLHDGPDVICAREFSPGQSVWLITRHELQREAFLDYTHFTSAAKSGLGQMLGVDWRLLPLESNPPEHALYRQVLNPYLTPAAIAQLETRIRHNCAALIDRFADDERVEFIEQFAIPFPSYIFLSLLGLPTDEAAQFLDWEAGLLRGRSIEERVRCGRAVMHYLQGFIAEQQRQPTTELMRGVTTASIDNRPITDDEILGLLYTLYLGGLDTVYSTTGWVIRHLANDQDLQHQLRADRSLLPAAVDEFIRLYGVVGTLRVIAEDFEFHGVKMKAGDRVVLPLYLAGRDPQAWNQPHEVDLTRKQATLSFASGPHVCVGRHLARLEIRIALEQMLERFSAFSLAEDEPWSFHVTPVVGIDRLVLSLQR